MKNNQNPTNLANLIAQEIRMLKSERESLINTLKVVSENAKKDLAVKESIDLESANDDRIIEDLTLELKQLQLQLAEKETNAANRLVDLINNVSRTSQSIHDRFSVSIQSLKDQYESLNNKNESIDLKVIQVLREGIDHSRHQIHQAIVNELKPAADNVLTALKHVSSNVIKGLTPLIREMQIDATAGLIPNDVIIKKYVDRLLERSRYLVYDLKKLKASSIDLEIRSKLSESKVSELQKSLSNYVNDGHENNVINADHEQTYSAPEFINIQQPEAGDQSLLETQSEPSCQSTYDSSIKTISSQIEDIKTMLRNELAEFNKTEAERDNKWQIFLENERNKHKSLLNGVNSYDFNNDQEEYIAKKTEELQNDFSNSTVELEKLAQNRVNKINEDILQADELERKAKEMYSVYDQQRKALENQLSEEHDKINVDILTNEIADRISSKFNEELQKFQFANPTDYFAELPPVAPMPNLIDENMFVNPQMPYYGPQNIYHQPVYQENVVQQPIQQIETSVEDELPNEEDVIIAEREPANAINITTRKAKFVKSDDAFHGRLSSEEIRKYANALITKNRRKQQNKSN